MQINVCHFRGCHPTVVPIIHLHKKCLLLVTICYSVRRLIIQYRSYIQKLVSSCREKERGGVYVNWQKLFGSQDRRSLFFDDKKLVYSSELLINFFFFLFSSRIQTPLITFESQNISTYEEDSQLTAIKTALSITRPFHGVR